MRRLKRRGQNRGSGRGNNEPRWFSRKKIPKKNTSGPAVSTIPELVDHYFDCNSFNEVDRYINTKEKIIQYLGIKYGGDVRVTLEKWRSIRFLSQMIQLKKGITKIMLSQMRLEIKLSQRRPEITNIEKKIFGKEIADYVERKQKLSRNLEIAYSVICGQCSETLQYKLKNLKNWETI